MASTDPDELYTLRNLFWLGSFQQAINEGGRLNRLSDELKIERDEFVYRSYVGQGQYALVISEVDDDAPVNLRAVKLLAEYLENPSGTRDGVVETLGTWLTEKETRENSTVQLVAAIIYQREDLQKEAFTALKKQSTMEQQALWAQMCLQINRCDLAEQSFKKLEAVDEDATLTQLVGAWINLHKGGDNTKEAAYTYEELIDKFGSSLTLLNGLAVAKMHQKDYDEAQKRLQEALGKKSDDADALINLITCSAHMGKDDKEINRYQQLLYGAHPNHPYVVNMKAKEAEFDRLAAEYLEKEGLEEDAEGNLVKVGN
jgi:coatomer protein complex subunit epsilon